MWYKVIYSMKSFLIHRIVVKRIYLENMKRAIQIYGGVTKRLQRESFQK